jgi:hypothetical protein
MKVLDLRCAYHHSFEGWFASEADYNDQKSRGLLTCPLCGDAAIEKLLSAPRLNLKAGREVAVSQAPAEGEGEGEVTVATAAPVPGPSREAMLATGFQARLVQAMREVLSKTEDVGDRFADEARGMHHGDITPRNIRGQTSPDEAQALIEEGIDLLALPVLPGFKGTLQ